MFLKAVRKRAGCLAEEIEIEDVLEVYQKEVGGYIEVLPLDACSMDRSSGETEEKARGIIIVCNEEGLLMNLQINFYTGPFSAVVGPAIFVGEEDSSFVSLTDEEIKFVKAWANNHSV